MTGGARGGGAQGPRVPGLPAGRSGGAFVDSATRSSRLPRGLPRPRVAAGVGGRGLSRGPEQN